LILFLATQKGIKLGSKLSLFQENYQAMQDTRKPQESTISTTPYPKSAAVQRLKYALFEKVIKTSKEAQVQCLEERTLKASMSASQRRQEDALVEECVTPSKEAQAHHGAEETTQTTILALKSSDKRLEDQAPEEECIPSKYAKVRCAEVSHILTS
jgi:hypothetical protein